MRAHQAITEGSQHYHVPCSGTKMDPNIYPIKSSQPSSLPQPVLYLLYLNYIIYHEQE